MVTVKGCGKLSSLRQKLAAVRPVTGWPEESKTLTTLFTAGQEVVSTWAMVSVGQAPPAPHWNVPLAVWVQPP